MRESREINFIEHLRLINKKVWMQNRIHAFNLLQINRSELYYKERKALKFEYN